MILAPLARPRPPTEQARPAPPSPHHLHEPADSRNMRALRRPCISRRTRRNGAPSRRRTHFRYAEMTVCRSSGSMRVERAVEPTRSANITVTWRALRRILDAGVLNRNPVGRRRPCARVRAQDSDGVQKLAAVPDHTDAHVFQIFGGQLGRIVSSIAFSRNTASYLSRPRLRSQPPRSMITPQRHAAVMIVHETTSPVTFLSIN